MGPPPPTYLHFTQSLGTAQGISLVEYLARYSTTVKP